MTPPRPIYVCYIVRCADGTLYTGVTTDMGRRVEEHNAGNGARYTASRRPVRLVWTEVHADRSAAQRREAEIKRWTRARKDAFLEHTATSGGSAIIDPARGRPNPAKE